MTGILTTARLVCKDASSRKTVLSAFDKIIAYTQPHEPEVLQYVCCLPVDDSLGTEIYMIEEYINQAASDAHLATQPVKDLIQLFSTSDVLAAAPEVHNCPVVHRKSINGPVSVSSDPAIVLAHTEYVAGDAAETMDGWKKLADGASREVTGVGLVIVTEDKETKGVRTQYVLRDWRGWDEFEKSSVVKEHKKGSQSKSDTVRIRAVNGFVGREEKRAT